MAYACNTAGFPRGGIASYAIARRHFDSVKPWRSKYNPGDEERPIGQREVKPMEGRQRFSKAMRVLDDGSIAFRLYYTDCVVWHPDNTLTVQGYASMSTTSFISYLTPPGVCHALGRKDCDEPILHLYDGPHYWSNGGRDHEIIQCSRPVDLHYNTARKRWEPIDYDSLRPFHVPVFDRRATRELSKHYHLVEFEERARLPMALALVGQDQRQRQLSFYERCNEIMIALESGHMRDALRLVERGTKRHLFTYRMLGCEDGAMPGFLRELRDYIYDSHGAVSRTEQRVLTLSQYRRFVQLDKRF